MSRGSTGGPAPAHGQLRQVEGDLVRVEVPGRPVRYCAAACPHRGGRLVHGRLDATRGRLVCPLHQSAFDVATGAVLSGAADEPLWVGSCPPVPAEEKA